MKITANGNEDATLDNARFSLGIAGVWDSATVAILFLIAEEWVPFKDSTGADLTFTANGGEEIVVPGDAAKVRATTSGAGGSVDLDIEFNRIGRN